MPVYEDDSLSIDLPSKWRIDGGEGPQAHSYHIKVGRGREVILLLIFADVESLEEQYNLALLQAQPLKMKRPRWTRTLINPLVVGDYEGFGTEGAHGDEITDCTACFRLEESLLHITAYHLRPAEREQLWKAIATLRMKPGYVQHIKSEWNKPEKMLVFDATDLTKPRRKTMKVWMDHLMVLLRDGDVEGDDWEDLSISSDSMIARVAPVAVFVMSRTEWGVSLEFVVRQAPARRHGGADWSDEATGVLAVPSGRLIVEQTTGGGLLEIQLSPGSYNLTTMRRCPPDADTASEDVETIRLELTPA